MAINATDTNRDICTEALRKIGVVAVDIRPTGDEIEQARKALSRLLKSWQNRGFNLWAVTSESVPATTAASHSLADGRPLEIQSIRLKKSGVETPMCEMTREEYDSLPVKTSTGRPTQYYFNRQRDTATFTVWPLLTSVSDETFEVTYVRELDDIDLNAQVDVPSEWYEATVYGLASRLADDYGVAADRVIARAEREFDLAKAYDREDSVFFVGPYAG